MSGSPLLPRDPRTGQGIDVLGIGQGSLDQVARLPAFPAFAGKAAMRSWHEHPGGQIATAVLACARLGLRTAFVGSVGEDDAGRRTLAPLRAAGVDVSGVVVRAGVRSQGAMILVDETSGERTVLWYRAPELTLRPADLAESALEGAGVVLLDAGDPELAIWVAERARVHRRPVVLDADTPSPEATALLGRVDFPIVPEAFACATHGTTDPAEALRAMAKGGASFPVITRGVQGALAWHEGRMLEAPAFAVPVRDTTGAGDVFHGAFAWGLLRGLDGETLLRVANAAAGMNCRVAGAQGGLPTLPELRDFLSGHGWPMEGLRR
ncbi:MAG: ribokinase [Deltaproteobacteria bacterium]|jgi:sugar/nucleoside kinase (ribokinase family)|nr:ribokinase [Deltaproteobacteria bacterium]